VWMVAWMGRGMGAQICQAGRPQSLVVPQVKKHKRLVL
jgi:hypothetical protein